MKRSWGLCRRGGGEGNRDGDDSTSRIFFFSLVREESGYHDDINDLVR